MGTFSWIRMLLSWAHPATSTSDRTLDMLIRDALRGDGLADPPAGAWDRLRTTIIERGRMHHGGMWLLDEPFRDPPEETRLSSRQLATVKTLHEARMEVLRRQERELVWSHLMPPFAMLLNV
ncbi:hypothetical protein [Aggregatilinea lenta]|uniref:hypothetical protein n=1 Tax=Aggregatilinea lenta TaxID=913108 RepID=UPI0013C2F472|nr:hypothetical protein [Aggregatilinea lenta]